jgi:hypothetical protein
MDSRRTSLVPKLKAAFAGRPVPVWVKIADLLAAAMLDDGFDDSPF